MSRNKSEVVFWSRQSGFIISFQHSVRRFGLIAAAAAPVPAAPPPPSLHRLPLLLLLSATRVESAAAWSSDW